MRAYIILDLGFGDAGKGLLTDFLARQTGAGLVVRYNGGAQAGHNVVTPDGRHHTFSQFGSASFIPGVRTYLSRHVVIHPAGLLAEGDLLRSKGLPDVFSRLRISDQALVITPFQQAANRLRELLRGSERHGSCGIGVGEAVEDTLMHPEDRVLAGDLLDPASLRRKCTRIREYKRQQMLALCGRIPPDSALAREFSLFERADLIEAWLASIARIASLGLVTPDFLLERWLRESDNVLFEGAQGVLLDQDAGFHPYTTWSRTTAANAIDILAEMAPGAQIKRIGLLRCYAVRHGPGPLPTEAAELAPLISEHNTTGTWQGPVRYGWFDAVLARYALQVTGGVDALMVTHLDVLSRLEQWMVCSGYKGFPALDDIPLDLNISQGVLTGFRASAALSLEQRARLTQALLRVDPMLEERQADEKVVLQKVEALLGRPVDLISRGSKASDVQIVNTINL